MCKWLKNKLRVWLGIEDDNGRIDVTVKDIKEDILCKTDARFRKLEKDMAIGIDTLVRKSKEIKFEVNSIQSQLDDTSKAISDVYQTVESVVSLGADIQPDMNHNKSWAVVCVEGKMNIVKFLPLNYKDADSMLKYLKSFPTSKSVYDTPPYFKNFGW